MVWLGFIMAFADIPPLVRAVPGFSGGIGGNNVSITVHMPAEITLHQPAALTLSVTNLQNPADVSLPTIPDTATFRIKSTHTDINNNIATFQYQFTPLTSGRLVLPPVEFLYYNPAAAEGKQVRRIATSELTFDVKDASPQVLPERFQTRLAVPSSPPFTPLRWHWLLPPIITGSVAGLYLLVWRWRNPHGARLAKILRRREVRTAFDRIERGDVDDAFRDYLSHRKVLEDPEIQALIRDLDAARYGQQPGTFAERVKAAIIRMEAASC